MSLIQIIKNAFAKQPQRLNRLDIKFHTEANFFGEHGKIVVTNKKLGLEEATVPFVFVGLSTPLPMDPDTMAYIWRQAELQGYIPIRITQYGRMNEKPFVDFQKATKQPDLNNVPAAQRNSGERKILPLPAVANMQGVEVPELVDGVFRSARAGTQQTAT